MLFVRLRVNKEAFDYISVQLADIYNRILNISHTCAVFVCDVTVWDFEFGSGSVFFGLKYRVSGSGSVFIER